MADETENAESGGENAAAVLLALTGASRVKADAFLDDQRHLIADQRYHLHLGAWEKRIGVFLRFATAIVGVAVAGMFGLMIWDAAHSSSLIIEPFAVPADLAARGVTGQVVAGQMLDKLTAMQDANFSSRPRQSYERNWGDNIKVEIPETGVSVGELQTFLKAWLGHDTNITGEVWHTQDGLAVTARETGQAGATFTGPESDLDGLIQKAAENVYGVTQPFRYANYLDRALTAPDIDARAARATVIYRQLIAGPNVQEQAWAWYGLAFIEGFIRHDARATIPYLKKAVALNPGFAMGDFYLTNTEHQLGNHEEAQSFGQAAKRLLDRPDVPDFDKRQLPLRRAAIDTILAENKGDFREAHRIGGPSIDAPEYFDNAGLTRDNYVTPWLGELAALHDGAAVRVWLLDHGISSIARRFPSGGGFRMLTALGDWPGVLEAEKTISERTYRNTPVVRAIVALAHAHMGDLAGAATRIAQCPDDSDDCLLARGQIADMQGRHAEADSWFASAEKREPSIPFADAAWGQSLLARGDADAAIEKFTLANQKGPHFADALEGWGEALIAKNQSHLALAKFSEAEKYAPNWGRLHLKWGEALVYAGKKDEAAKQFARAAQLDLTASEKAELSRDSYH